VEDDDDDDGGGGGNDKVNDVEVDHHKKFRTETLISVVCGRGLG
jgi:hypothetical protein